MRPDSLVRERLDAVRALFEEVSADVARFEAATGLACRSGCGACCEAPTVEATTLELLPMAARLWDAGEAEAMLHALATAEDGFTCVSYRGVPGRPGSGRCARYEDRPVVCRLFGGAAFRHRTGRLELVTCRVRREDGPAEVARAESALEGPAPAPVFADVGHRVIAIDPGLGTERLPINEALQRALAWVGLRRGLEGADSLASDDGAP